ncbi:MAG: sigma-70 family polymerase sigma factor, partial [Solirubrobacterales bacterium]|nr:sigma-70 family polymerase sigma factor [Solirubrobacterales bacterium]
MALLDESPARALTRPRCWSSTSDAALVRGATAGHDGAFEEIFARYHAPLVRYCRGILLDDDVAQDAAQNALMSAMRALGAGTSLPQALSPWLYRIAQREAIDLAGRRRREAARQDTDGAELLANVPAPADQRVRDRLRELLGDLSRLPLRQRSALLLRELSGLGYAEIAVALDTTPAAARQSVLEARQALAQSGSGRQDSCSAVRQLVDGGDRRRLRARRVRAHLDDCLPCQAFAATIADRRRDLALLFPLGPAAIVSSSGAFAALTGGGAAAGGGAVA